MKAFILCSDLETTRLENVSKLEQQLRAAQWQVERVAAIYPSQTKVPFLQRLVQLSRTRTGYALLPAEIGCLLGHRKIWRLVLTDRKYLTEPDEKGTHYLVLESDSQINDLPALTTLIQGNNSLADMPLPQQKGNTFQSDLFFWGAWLGHMKLLRSTRLHFSAGSAPASGAPKNPTLRYTLGEPFIKSVYCTYGYSLNAKAAAYLLQQTQKINYPVDQFKHFVQPGKIKIGGILPEIISGGAMGSYINQTRIQQWQRKIFMHLLDIKNNLICFFK